jgi:hypothetical protein
MQKGCSHVLLAVPVPWPASMVRGHCPNAWTCVVSSRISGHPQLGSLHGLTTQRIQTSVMTMWQPATLGAPHPARFLPKQSESYMAAGPRVHDAAAAIRNRNLEGIPATQHSGSQSCGTPGQSAYNVLRVKSVCASSKMATSHDKAAICAHNGSIYKVPPASRGAAARVPSEPQGPRTATEPRSSIFTCPVKQCLCINVRFKCGSEPKHLIDHVCLTALKQFQCPFPGSQISWVLLSGTNT